MHVDDAEMETALRQALSQTAETVTGAGVERDAVVRAVTRRRRSRRNLRVGLAATGIAAAVAAVVMLRIADDPVDTVSGPSSSTTTTEPSTTSTTPSTSATTSSSTSSSTPETTAGSSTTATTGTSTPALPEFPPEFTGLTQGGSAWGLYLAVAPQYEAPELQGADAVAGEAGYSSGQGFSDLACDEGAAQALGVSGTAYTVSLYFETEAQAVQAREAFQARGHSVAGVALVTTRCLD